MLAEREQDLYVVENRVDRERREREALTEEMAAMKSVLHNTSSQDLMADSPHGSRVCAICMYNYVKADL